MTDRKPSAADVVAGCIATRLRLAARAITKLYDDALRPFGLTVAQMSMLAVAAHRGVIRQAEASAQLRMDNSTLSRNLELMRENGWLEVVNESDARVHSHQLTEAGLALFERAVPNWRVAQQWAGELLGEAGVEALHRFARASGFEG
jgi:DNA-binding MarR family transcriptional regulator